MWTRCGPEAFRALEHRDRLPAVLMSLAAAAGAGLTPVKVNPAQMRSVNNDQAAELPRFCGRCDRGSEARICV